MKWSPSTSSQSFAWEKIMSSYVLKWTVPVDDQPHEIGGGVVVHVDSQYGRSDEVQVWTIESSDAGASRRVQVFATGQRLLDNAQPLGSTMVAGGRLVWHLMELRGSSEEG